MKKTLLGLVALAAVSSTSVFAQTVATEPSPWQLRVRAVNIDSADKDGTGLALRLSEKTIPEVDVSYFFSPNVAAELILTYPQKHTLRADGDRVGTLKHLPPTLLAQYHFTQFGAFKPYVGAGINYTRFSSVRLDVPGASIKKNSTGAALQVGMDYALDSHWMLNFDVKKLQIKTDLSVGGNKVGRFKADPVLIGVGVGYRF